MNDLFFKLFDFFTSIGEKVSSGNPDIEGSSDFYFDYFKETSVCSSIFLIGLVVAVVAAVVFYYVICNKVQPLAKRYVWCIMLVLVGGLTFVLSVSSIVGEDNDDPELSTGVFYTAHNVTETRLLDGTDDEEARDEIVSAAEDYRAQFKTSDDSIESLPYEMGGVNGLISAVWFFIFSLLMACLRKHTIHGAGIPF